MRRSMLLAAVPLVSAAATAARAQSAGRFVFVTTAGYDLYASSTAVLEASRAQLDSARAQFARYFPGPVPKMHVVAAETRDQLRTFDVEGLRKQVGDVLAWTVSVTQVQRDGTIMEMSSGSTRATGLLGNLSAVIAPTADGKATVVRFVPPTGAGSGVEVRAGDVIRALNGRAMPTPAALNEAYNAIASGAQVSLTIDRDGSERAISFAKPAGAPRVMTQNPPPGPTSSGGAAPRPGAIEPRVLSHEAGHHLLGLWAAEHAHDRKPPQHPATADLVSSLSYGSPLLPDWLDEAGATLSESPSQQGERRKYIADNYGAIIPLAKFFTAEHPVLPGLREMARGQMTSGGSGPGPVEVKVRRSPDALDPGMFYAQSLSVPEFLAEREGPAFLGRLTDALLHGQTLESVLESAKNLPKTIDALHREWQKWVTR